MITRAGTRSLKTYLAAGQWNMSASSRRPVTMPIVQWIWTTPPRTGKHLVHFDKALKESNIRQAQKSLTLALDHGENVPREAIRRLLMLLKKSRNARDLDYLCHLVFDMKSRAGLPALHYEYHALMYAYGLHKQPEKARKLLDRMREANHKPNIYTYNTLLGCYKRVNDDKSALRLLNEMKNDGITPDVGTFNTLIHLLDNTHQTQLAYAMYDRMREQGVRPDKYTFSALIDIATKDNNTTMGDKLIADMMASDTAVDVVTVNTMLRYKAVTGKQLSPVLDLYYAIPKRFPRVVADTVTYNVMLDACVKLDNPAKALSIYKDMQRAGCKPDVVTYGVLLEALGRTDDVDEALTLLDDMRQNNIVPSRRILSTAANLTKSARLETVRKVLDVIEQATARDHTLRLDTLAYNALLCGLARHGASADAQRLYDAVFRDHQVEADLVTYNQLILAYVNDGLLEDAMDIYYELREHHRSPKPNARHHIKLDTTFYTTLISAMTNASTLRPTSEPTFGHVVEDLPDHQVHDSFANTPESLLTALTLFNDMRQLQIRPNAHVYTAMVHAAAQYRDAYVLEQIHRLIRMDLYFDPDTAVYNALMDGYNRVGDGHTVLQMWDVLALSSAPETAIDQVTIAIVLDSCGHNGFGYKAEPIWRMVKRAGFQLSTNNYNSYIECLCRSTKGREGWDKAWHVVQEEMRGPLRAGPNDDRPEVDEKTLNTLLSFARKKGFTQQEMQPVLDYRQAHFPDSKSLSFDDEKEPV